MINFPYYRDAVDPDIPDPDVWEPFGIGNASGLTAFVLGPASRSTCRPNVSWSSRPRATSRWSA